MPSPASPPPAKAPFGWPRDRVRLGRRLETAAARFLREQGCRLLTRNYHCRRGEVDLVMLDPQGTLLFVEVRYRSTDRFCGAAESVGPRKRERLRYTAAHYLRRYPRLAALPCRFDIIAFDPGDGESPSRLSWLKDAFH